MSIQYVPNNKKCKKSGWSYKDGTFDANDYYHYFMAWANFLETCGGYAAT